VLANNMCIYGIDPVPPCARQWSAAHTNDTQMQIHKPNHAHTTLRTHITVFAFALTSTWAACIMCYFAFALTLAWQPARIMCCVTYQLNGDSAQVSVYNQITCSILAAPSIPLLNMVLITTGASTACKTRTNGGFGVWSPGEWKHYCH